MLSVYVDVAAFAVVAALVPALMLLVSALMRHRSDGNAVKNANYESAEQTIGIERGVMEEYFHYFALFLGFEIVGIIMLLWAAAAREIGLAYGVYIFLVTIVAVAFIVLGIAIAHRR